jgi:hypothetical protein
MEECIVGGPEWEILYAGCQPKSIRGTVRQDKVDAELPLSKVIETGRDWTAVPRILSPRTPGDLGNTWLASRAKVPPSAVAEMRPVRPSTTRISSAVILSPLPIPQARMQGRGWQTQRNQACMAPRLAAAEKSLTSGTGPKSPSVNHSEAR